MAAHYDVIVIGAGAAGLMCAATAGYRGQNVLLLEHAARPGRKILMSGGGRCNFTNLNSTPANFLSANPSFCISALKRYTPQNFLDLVERHGIDHVEKAAGQLFCQGSSRDILDMLLTECDWAGVEIRLKTSVSGIRDHNAGFRLETSGGTCSCDALVIATGGLSIPTMGATGFAYDIARQYGHTLLPTRAGLVPFTLHPEFKTRLAPLAGVSCPVTVHCNGEDFSEPMLVTHRGLSGPAMLQISSYWQPGDTLTVDLLPGRDVAADLYRLRRSHPGTTLNRYLCEHLPRRFAAAFAELQQWHRPLQEQKNQHLDAIAGILKGWPIAPAGTEGYRTAEVTLGGIDTHRISSRTMMSEQRKGLYFIGEALDVTGHLGGHNFQWAWASAVAAGTDT